MTEEASATASAPATAFCSFTAGFVGPCEPAVAIALTAAAPSMARTAPFVAKIHFVQVKRASAHEIAT
ncbi:hypothetical protein [Pandoraea apista]|uniref:hypothetical protein n=1 Tax=Pandoraea apista TaxID=93218 RepID=UPI00248DD0C2|nr:hypothetical protein [Pandoraea apista]